MVAAIGRQHLEPARVQARHADGVLVRLGPAVREEHPIEVAGRELCDETGGLAPGVVREGRLDGAEALGLLDDRRDEPRVLVADVDVHELRGEVEISIALVVLEVRARCPRDRERVDEGLCRPGVEDVCPVVPSDRRLVVRQPESRFPYLRVRVHASTMAQSRTAPEPPATHPGPPGVIAAIGGKLEVANPTGSSG